MLYYVIRIVGGTLPGGGAPELIASFPTLDEAQRVAQSAQQNDPTNKDEFLVATDPERLIPAVKELD